MLQIFILLALCCLPVEKTRAFSPLGLRSIHPALPSIRAPRFATNIPLLLEDDGLVDDPDDTTLDSSLPTPRWVCPEESDVCDVTGVTLSRYMVRNVHDNYPPLLRPSMSALIIIVDR
jgi:hypothetical protein